jgi:hypothetical protein
MCFYSGETKPFDSKSTHKINNDFYFLILSLFVNAFQHIVLFTLLEQKLIDAKT